jgi:uncharacterized protein YcaQ
LPWPAARRKKAELLLNFVRERGIVHPREVDGYFAHGKVKNYWGGSSNATTHLLDAMQYQGLLRVVRREAGIRLYAAQEHAAVAMNEMECEKRIDALADAAISIYAPLPLASLRFLMRRLRFAVPQWEEGITDAIRRAKERLAHTKVDGTDWYWPREWKLRQSEPDHSLKLLTPFDPVVWDRWRFEKLWGWTYRFEAYTPLAKRVRGYYAMPLLWRDEVIGWGNLAVKDGELNADFGFVSSAPRERAFRGGLAEELERMRNFLKIDQPDAAGK